MSELRLGVDVGGTFTDLVTLSEGTLLTTKVPSTPRDKSEGVMNAVNTSGAEFSAVSALAHGMTVATNALLERRGAWGVPEDLLTFDMGGTSTDVAPVVGGEAQTTTETVIAGVPIKLPMVDVHTVSAGGGSVAWADAGGALRVGPQSGGAEPAPAAYDKGGEESAVTDANLYLGYLADEAELGGEVVLRRNLSEKALEALGKEVGLSALEVALGIVRVADAEVVWALRVISVERGLDPRGFALLAFGGAGGMHACTLAEELVMSTVLVPRVGGVLSALGLAISDLWRDYVRPYLADLTDVKAAELKEAFKDMENTAAEDLEGSRYTRRADLRYQGQSFEITVEAEKPFEVEKLEGRFHAAHKQRYGYRMDDEPVDLVNLRFIATLPVEKPKLEEPVAEGAEASSEATRRETNFGGEWIEVPVLDRERMGEGSEVEGPAVVEFKESTCVVRPGWRGVVDEVGTLVLEKR